MKYKLNINYRKIITKEEKQAKLEKRKQEFKDYFLKNTIVTEEMCVCNDLAKETFFVDYTEDVKEKYSKEFQNSSGFGRCISRTEPSHLFGQNSFFAYLLPIECIGMTMFDVSKDFKKYSKKGEEELEEKREAEYRSLDLSKTVKDIETLINEWFMSDNREKESDYVSVPFKCDLNIPDWVYGILFKELGLQFFPSYIGETTIDFNPEDFKPKEK